MNDSGKAAVNVYLKAQRLHEVLEALRRSDRLHAQEVLERLQHEDQDPAQPGSSITSHDL
jgi:hypothetical protein